jgi:hypothetical protein
LVEREHGRVSQPPTPEGSLPAMEHANHRTGCNASNKMLRRPTPAAERGAESYRIPARIIGRDGRQGQNEQADRVGRCGRLSAEADHATWPSTMHAQRRRITANLSNEWHQGSPQSDQPKSHHGNDNVRAHRREGRNQSARRLRVAPFSFAVFRLCMSDASRVGNSQSNRSFTIDLAQMLGAKTRPHPTGFWNQRPNCRQMGDV